MRQMVIRITAAKEDAEVLVKDGERQIWKSVDLKAIREKLDKYVCQTSGKPGKPKLVDRRIIAMNERVLIYRENEKRRMVFYGGKSYEINYPAAVYVVEHTSTQVTEIKCFTYFGWKGMKTNLYLFPMPNMTSSERMCMGTADRSIIDGDVIGAVERIVDAEYTHDHVDNVRKKTSTIKWLKMLGTGHVTSKLLKKPVRRFEDLVDTGGANERT